MARAKRNAKTASGVGVGRRIIDGLTELSETVQSGRPLQERFTVRTCRRLPVPASYEPSRVRRTREALGVSQAIFADIVGTSTSLVQSWEQGFRKPSRMACRLLDEINRNREHWRGLVSGQEERT